MLTRRGWMLAASSIAFFVGGWLFAIVELTILAVAILLLCAGAAAFVEIGRAHV